MSEVGLNRVVLAISAFRSDETVISLLGRAFGPGEPRFGAVIVVDSLGSGAIADAIEKNGWPVRYVNSETNLGSAGNLDRRLTLAAETGLDWCLTLNHDAELDLKKAERLLKHGQNVDRVGAVYPRLRFTAADGRLDTPRRTFSTIGILRSPNDRTETVDVSWSSSNGALYRLDAVRSGVSAWPELWMGFEDLAIGWEMQRQNWRQLLAQDVTVDDNYEFQPVNFLGRTIYLANKPAWYAYYQSRNLALIAKGTQSEAIGWTSVVLRTAMSAILAIVHRQSKTRIIQLLKGLIDGTRGIGGKGRYP